MSIKPINVGSERQLFLDDLWFFRHENIEKVLHQPQLKEVVLESDRPWESAGIHYSSVLQEGSCYRMWYRADEGHTGNNSDENALVCYAESQDGIHWKKPDLGLVKMYSRGTNNIIFHNREQGINPSVILDTNATPDERYKMIVRGSGPNSILGYTSPNGINWNPVSKIPILTEGPFDSHNILLWDNNRHRYVITMRGVDQSIQGPFFEGRRAIRRSESEDFRQWSKPELVITPSEGDPANLHLYTNAAVKYERAARAYFMFPMVLYPDRRYPTAPYPGLSDVQFACSRDGIHWKREFRHPFLTPGLDEKNWVDRNPIMGAGILQTGPKELSMYYSERLRSNSCRFRRCTLRPDGFVSIHGPYNGWGEFTTPPLLFSGRQLVLNYSTSGGGSIFVELQNDSGQPIPGFSMENCLEIFGDRIEGLVKWEKEENVSRLLEQPVSLKIRMRDAHLFAFHFSG